ncbi:hypothetical protein BDR05DRAFT_996031 [Suillus weaverae]|nr:hypothetical protein BDR05DRAFT_996031 [Suillus weaverae]
MKLQETIVAMPMTRNTPHKDSGVCLEVAEAINKLTQALSLSSSRIRLRVLTKLDQHQFNFERDHTDLQIPEVIGERDLIMVGMVESEMATDEEKGEASSSSKVPTDAEESENESNVPPAMSTSKSKSIKVDKGKGKASSSKSRTETEKEKEKSESERDVVLPTRPKIIRTYGKKGLTNTTANKSSETSPKKASEESEDKTSSSKDKSEDKTSSSKDESEDKTSSSEDESEDKTSSSKESGDGSTHDDQVPSEDESMGEQPDFIQTADQGTSHLESILDAQVSSPFTRSPPRSTR